MYVLSLSLSLCVCLILCSTLEKEAAASSEAASRALADKEEEAAGLRERVRDATEEKQVTHMSSHYMNLCYGMYSSCLCLSMSTYPPHPLRSILSCHT